MDYLHSNGLQKLNEKVEKIKFPTTLVAPAFRGKALAGNSKNVAVTAEVVPSAEGRITRPY